MFTCRFTSDVKIKGIAVVGGAGGTSPSRMNSVNFRSHAFLFS